MSTESFSTARKAGVAGAVVAGLAMLIVTGLLLAEHGPGNMGVGLLSGAAFGLVAAAVGIWRVSRRSDCASDLRACLEPDRRRARRRGTDPVTGGPGARVLSDDGGRGHCRRLGTPVEMALASAAVRGGRLRRVCLRRRQPPELTMPAAIAGSR